MQSSIVVLCMFLETHPDTCLQVKIDIRDVIYIAASSIAHLGPISVMWAIFRKFVKIGILFKAFYNLLAWFDRLV